MSDEKQDNTPPSASDDFRNGKDGDTNDAEKKKKYEVKPPRLMKVPDFYSSFPWSP